MLDAICDAKESDMLYRRIDKNTPITNKDTVASQDCVMLYPRNIWLKLRNNEELASTERVTIVGLYL